MVSTAAALADVKHRITELQSAIEKVERDITETVAAMKSAEGQVSEVDAQLRSPALRAKEKRALFSEKRRLVKEGQQLHRKEEQLRNKSCGKRSTDMAEWLRAQEEKQREMLGELVDREDGARS